MWQRWCSCPCLPIHTFTFNTHKSINRHTHTHCLAGLVVKASASRAEDPGFQSHLRWLFFSQVESWLKNWHSSGYPARHLTLYGQRWDWLARRQYTLTGWGRKFGLQLLSQCGSTHNCLSGSVPEIHLHICWDVKQPTKNNNIRTRASAWEKLWKYSASTYRDDGDWQKCGAASSM